MKRVIEVENGCGIAVLQIITGKPVTELAEALHFQCQEIDKLAIFHYLESVGYSLTAYTKQLRSRILRLAARIAGNSDLIIHNS